MTVISPIGVAPPSPVVEFWNQILGPKFIRFRHVLVAGLARHSEAVLPFLRVRPGHPVLDVGCGFGDTAIDLARRIRPLGEVLGVDCCQAFLDIARQDAEDRHATNVRFENCDVERGLGGSGSISSLRALERCSSPTLSLDFSRCAGPSNPKARWRTLSGAGAKTIPGSLPGAKLD